jgi:predicted phosphate transport protein (TIGR00153 family)
VAFRLIPKEEKFFDDFVAMAEQIRVGAGLLQEMVAPDQPLWDKADEIKEVEHKCDFLTHSVIQRLHKTFVTPLDREDIHALARSLDDVIDAIDDSAAVLRLYKIDRVRQEARDQVRIIVACTDQLVSAMKALGKKQQISGCAVEINRLENEADRIHEAALRRLFEEERDAITIIKWKEILDFLEVATDRCEDIANVLEGVVVKHA